MTTAPLLRYGSAMPHVIAEPCIGTKDRSCVEVCPVDCVHGDGESPMLYIDPQVCIDCGACVAVCPLRRFIQIRTCPARWEHFTEINAAYYEKEEATR